MRRGGGKVETHPCWRLCRRGGYRVCSKESWGVSVASSRRRRGGKGRAGKGGAKIGGRGRGKENRRTVCSFRISSSKLTSPGLAAVTRSWEGSAWSYRQERKD